MGGYDPWYWAEYSHSAPTHQETKYGVIFTEFEQVLSVSPPGPPPRSLGPDWHPPGLSSHAGQPCNK